MRLKWDVHLEKECYRENQFGLLAQEAKTPEGSDVEASALKPRAALPQPTKHQLLRASRAGKRDLTQRLSDDLSQINVSPPAFEQASNPPLEHVEQDQNEASFQHGPSEVPGTASVLRSSKTPAQASPVPDTVPSIQISSAPGLSISALEPRKDRKHSSPGPKSTLDPSNTLARKGAVSNIHAKAVPREIESRELQVNSQEAPAAQFADAGSHQVRSRQIRKGHTAAHRDQSQLTKIQKQQAEDSSGRSMSRRVRRRLSGDEDDLFQDPVDQKLSASGAAEELQEKANSGKRSRPPSADTADALRDTQTADSMPDTKAQLLTARAEGLHSEMHQVLQLHDQLLVENDEKDSQDAAFSPLKSSESRQAPWHLHD